LAIGGTAKNPTTANSATRPTSHIATLSSFFARWVRLCLLRRSQAPNQRSPGQRENKLRNLIPDAWIEWLPMERPALSTATSIMDKNPQPGQPGQLR
jgi:hypothetical protein